MRGCCLGSHARNQKNGLGIGDGDCGPLRFSAGQRAGLRSGYSHYTWHNRLTDKGSYWVTRARPNMHYEVVSERPLTSGCGMQRDQGIRLTGAMPVKAALRPIRWPKHLDAETNSRYVFLTNQQRSSAQTVADIYKSRWEVQLFCKWIKQNLKIRSVVDHSLNAVATRIFVALCVQLLMAFQKFVSALATQQEGNAHHLGRTPAKLLAMGWGYRPIWTQD